MDYLAGAGLGAKSATDATARIYICNTPITDAYRISRADLHTIAVAKAGIGAHSVSREIHLCRLAGLRAVIFILSLIGGA